MTQPLLKLIASALEAGAKACTLEKSGRTHQVANATPALRGCASRVAVAHEPCQVWPTFKLRIEPSVRAEVMSSVPECAEPQSTVLRYAVAAQRCLTLDIVINTSLYAFHLDAAGDEGTSAWPDADEEDDALDAETFADDVAQLSHTIEDLSRSLRLEHLQKNRDAKIAAKAEAARREKEAELRRARRKEQMARDPKRKVALRLEQGRHALSKATTPVSGAQEVPLVPFHSDGCGVSNKAPVPIVDVLKIQPGEAARAWAIIRASTCQELALATAEEPTVPLASELAVILGQLGLKEMAQIKDAVRRAQEFAEQADDGVRLDLWREADVILVGPSRTGKTTLAKYLAKLGLRAANYPLVPGEGIPPELAEIGHSKVALLTTEAKALQSIRQGRMKRLGVAASNYAALGQIREELNWVKCFYMQKFPNFPVVNTAKCSIAKAKRSPKCWPSAGAGITAAPATALDDESYSWMSAMLDEETIEERLAKVKARRDLQNVQKIRHKLSNMRSECPIYLCRAYGVMDEYGNPAQGRQARLDSFNSSVSGNQDSRRGSLEARGEWHLKNGRRKNVRSPAAGLRQAMRRGSAIVDERIKQLERAKKLRQCRLRMRACVQWLKILFRKRHRDDCIEKCLVLLRQLGEWVRIRGALKQFMNHVKTIQRTMRDYLGMKRRRCYIIEKDWCRIEDLNLSVHAQHKAQNAMQDWQSKGRAKRRLFQAAVEASVSNKWKLIVDISSFRIPVAERRAVISAYHKRAIKRHMVIGKTFLQLVFDALKASRELDSFLNQFNYGGGSKSAVDSMSIKREDLVIDSAQDPNELSYWQMPEEGAKKGSSRDLAWRSGFAACWQVWTANCRRLQASVASAGGAEDQGRATRSAPSSSAWESRCIGCRTIAWPSGGSLDETFQCKSSMTLPIGSNMR
ncbi:unnamed protein product [Effrenium voratum]|nr:unnamed protein product [Effrenium voratum]